MVVTTELIAPLIFEAVGVQPRHYQRKGIEFLWEHKRAMLTDAPGLGKTPQGALASEPPVLVVCPNYLTKQWFEWLEEHFPKRKTLRAVGNRYAKERVLDEDADFHVINVEMLRTHYDQIVALSQGDKWKTVIFDESHHLRSKGSVQAMAAVVVASSIPRVYELTATPIWKDPDDLFMQLRILQPRVFTSYYDFVDMFMIKDESRYGTKILGVQPDMRDELDSLLDIMRIGRSYADAGREIPKVIPKFLTLDFDEKHKKLYRDAAEYWMVQDINYIMTNYMQVLHALREITFCEDKIDAIVQEVLSDKEPCVVFTWYTDHAFRLSAAINAAGREALPITGDWTADERRERAVGNKIVVANIAALSEGIDLSWARKVIFCEEHWPPGSHTQALARVRRERQLDEYLSANDNHSYWDEILDQLSSRDANAEPVVVVYAHMKDTIDQIIHGTSQRRQATIRDLMKETLGI